MLGNGSRRSLTRLRAHLVDVRPLRHRAFRRLWLSGGVTAVSSQLTAVAVPKQVYDITGSSAWVGIASFVSLIPLVIFALWGGSIADVVDRRRMMLATNSGIAVTSILLWVQALLGLNSIPVLLVLVAVQQGFVGANSPARGASLPRLLPADELAAANALNGTTMGLGFFLGPLVAGALIPVLGLRTLYLLDSGALLVALGLIRGLPPLPAQVGEVMRRARLGDITDGLRYIVAAPALFVSFVADIIAMVFGMPRALFPQMAVETFGDPPGGGVALGVLFCAIPLGGLIGGLLSGSLTRLHHHGQLVTLSIVGWAVAVIGFGLSGPLWLAALFLGLAGVADLVSMIFRSTILQAATTDEMRGRTQGVFFMVIAGGPRLADLVHGVSAEAVGARRTVVAGGVLCIAAMVALVLARPRFWTYDARTVGSQAQGAR